MTGQGVKQDPEQAMKWLKAAALQGNADAQFFVGSMYLLPKKDIAEVVYCEIGNVLGDSECQRKIGDAGLLGPNAPACQEQGAKDDIAQKAGHFRTILPAAGTSAGRFPLGSASGTRK